VRECVSVEESVCGRVSVCVIVPVRKGCVCETVCMSVRGSV
jgi:hypothetical protein